LAQLPEILRTTSAGQARRLQDGLLTVVEHEQAFAEYLRCIEVNGGQVTEASRDGSGRLMRLGVGFANNPLGDATPIVESCRDEHYSDIEFAWWVALHFDETEEMQLARIIACAASRGYRLPVRPANFGELVRAAEALDGPQEPGHHGAARDAIMECTDLVQ